MTTYANPVSISQLQKFAPHCDFAVIAPLLSDMMTQRAINTRMRVCHFMAQCFEESGGFTVYRENLSYSTPGRLVEVFPSHFSWSWATDGKENPAAYVDNPVALGNLVYDGLYGNGANEGYKYRAGGFLSLTFKSTYQACDKSLGTNFTDNPDLLTKPVNAIVSAGWIWYYFGLNPLADTNNLIAITRKLEGSDGDLQQRRDALNRALNIWKE